MPNPYTNLPNISGMKSVLLDWITVPTKKAIAATFSSSFLPMDLSPIKIINIEEMIAPNKLALAISPSWKEFNCPKDDVPSPSIRKTDEEDPISKPNINPPNDAVPKDGSHEGNNDFFSIEVSDFVVARNDFS